MVTLDFWKYFYLARNCITSFSIFFVWNIEACFLYWRVWRAFLAYDWGSREQLLLRVVETHWSIQSLWWHPDRNSLC